MARNLSNKLKRVVASVCALMIVAGTLPVQPIADLIKQSEIMAVCGCCQGVELRR